MRPALLNLRLSLDVCLCVIVIVGLAARVANTQAPLSVPITINTPEAKTFDLALDEIELDWSENDPGRTLSRTASPVAGTRVTVSERTRAVIEVTSAADVSALVARSIALQAANPGSEANFVLYERGQRSASARYVLTTHATLLLTDPADPTGALVEYAGRNPQPIDGVPGAYVLEAADPLSAVQLADALRLRAGVKDAYPLLKQQLFAR